MISKNTFHCSPAGSCDGTRPRTAVRYYPIEFVAPRISREGNSPRLATTGGYATLTDNAIHRFQVSKTGTIPIDRFPPPPSYY